MSTPRKKFNYNSPYAQNVPQYPSQTSEYMTQHAGGGMTPNKPQQLGFYEDRQNNCTPTTNVPHFYQNSPQQQTPPGRNFAQRGRGRPYGTPGRNFGRPYTPQQRGANRSFDFKDKDTFSQYFHNSMLEDPWRDLVARQEAIQSSTLQHKESEGSSDEDNVQSNKETIT